tara:strand:+ start:329 stop:493 length:165 start_codon:yes stop_codon:yes gene_type:complete
MGIKEMERYSKIYDDPRPSIAEISEELSLLPTPSVTIPGYPKKKHLQRKENFGE